MVLVEVIQHAPFPCILSLRQLSHEQTVGAALEQHCKCHMVVLVDYCVHFKVTKSQKHLASAFDGTYRHLHYCDGEKMLTERFRNKKSADYLTGIMRFSLLVSPHGITSSIQLTQAMLIRHLADKLYSDKTHVFLIDVAIEMIHRHVYGIRFAVTEIVIDFIYHIFVYLKLIKVIVNV